MRKTYIIGIDPGLSGGLAILSSVGPPMVTKMPIKEISGMKRPSPFDINHWITSYSMPFKRMIFIEKSLPIVGSKRGMQQIQTTEQNYGFLLGVLSQLNDINEINVKDWQKEMLGDMPRCMTTKEASIAKCQEMYNPSLLLPTSRSTKPHDGIADALMIATYGQRLLNKNKKETTNA